MPSFAFASVVLRCTAEKQCVRVGYVIEAEVFASGFTMLPLIPATAAVVGLDIVSPGGTNVGEAHLLPEGSMHTLMCTKPGVYKISLQVLVPYTNASVKQAVQVASVESCDTFLALTLPDADVSVSVSPAIWTRVGSHSKALPSLAGLETPLNDPVPDLSSASYALARIPASKTINLKWTANQLHVPVTPATPTPTADREPQKEEPAEKKEMVVTSNQDVAYTIGGGICHMRLQQTYTITNGSLSQVKLLVGPHHGSAPVSTSGRALLGSLDATRKCRILSVVGPSVRTWEITHTTLGEALEKKAPQDAQAASSSSSSSSALPCQVLEVAFDSAVEGTVQFVIGAELQLVDTSCKICVPSLMPLHVNRNKGAVAVQAQSSVEIKEGEAKALTKVDIAELPPALAGGSALFGYKYLTSHHRLCLEAVKHDDVDVVIALVESVQYTITHTGDQLLYDLQFNIKNTQRQYLKIQLPERSSVWTTSVGGEIVKPASDQSGKTLVPLLKGSNVAFNVKLVYVCSAPRMPEGRKVVRDLVLTFPAVDLPIMHMRVSLWVPATHIYSAFEGAIEEVDRFDDSENLQQVHNAGNYGAAWTSSSKVAKRKKGVEFFSQNVPPPRRPVRQAQVRHMPQQQQVMPAPPQQQMMHAPLQVQMQTNMVANFEDSMSADSSEDEHERCMSITMGSNDDDDEEEDMLQEEGAEDFGADIAGGAMAQGIKPLAVNTAGLTVGKKFLFERLLVPANLQIVLKTETCIASEKRRRTAANDK